jgi:hypothetical protein
MDRFIWIGKRCVNLDCVVHFTLLEDGRISVLLRLRDVEAANAQIMIEGAEAEALHHELECAGLPKSSPALDLAHFAHIPGEREYPPVIPGAR